MQDRRHGDRLYTALVVAFLIALVALGVIGVPTLLVAAIGAAAAAVAIALFHSLFEAPRAPARGGGRRPARVPAKYVPSVLEGSSMRRRRLGGLRRHRHASPPLRFR